MTNGIGCSIMANNGKGGSKKMECRHGAVLDVKGGRKCLLCGAFIPAVNEQKQAENPPVDEGKGKPTGKKRTAKKAV
jgi:hypothetical protein